MKHVRDHSAATGPTKSVLMMIAMRANEQEGHTCYPGIEKLSDDSGFSERTVKKAVRWLVDNGEIVILERGGFRGGVGYANRYQVTFKYPETYGHEVHIRDDLQAPESPLQERGAPRNGHVSPLEGAPQTPQRKEKPQVVNPEEERKGTPPKPPEGGSALSPEYRTFIERCRVWNDGEEPENSGKAEEDFHSLLAEGHTVVELFKAYRGACDAGTTDLTEILVADRIKDFVEADPMSGNWRRVAA